MMSYSHPAVHPIDVPPSQANPNANVNVNVNGHFNNNGNLVVNNVPARVRMKDCQGMPGTLGGLFLRIAQLGFAVAAFSVMLSIEDFSTVTAFCYLVAATVLQCLWSLSLAFIDGYALLVKRSLRNSLIVSLFVVGDGVTGLLTFAAACASAGITVLIENDLRECHNNHCGKYETATAMAFLSWFTVSPSFFLNFWLLASR